MANRRMIASDIFEDDFIGSLSYFERLLWIGLITSVADDQGRMMDNPALIRSNVFLYDKVEDSQVENTISRFSVACKIARYVAGDKHLLQIVNWWKYQTPSWASPSKYPPPTNWVDRYKYHTTGNKVIVCNWDNVGGYVGGYVVPLDRPIEERRGEDGEVKGEVEVKELPPRPNIYSIYEQEIGCLTPMLSQQLDEIDKTYPEGWFELAVKKAHGSTTRITLNYLLTILKDWKANGVTFNNNGHKPAAELSGEWITLPNGERQFKVTK